MPRSNSIGDNWDPVAWSKQDFYHQNKAMAAQFAPLEARSSALFDEAATNLQKPEGGKVSEGHRAIPLDATSAHGRNKCTQDDTDRTIFEFMLQVAADGGPQEAWMLHPAAIGNCLLKRIYDAHAKNETPFTTPPHPGYWLKIKLDPATTVAAKQSSALRRAYAVRRAYATGFN